jgi:putative glutamine amidotransferase
MGTNEGSPLIGVTTSEVRPATLTHPAERSDPARPEMALGMTYMRAVQQAGGAPVVIPPLGNGQVEALLDRLDGVLLSGGPDIDPTLYRDASHPELGPTWRELDELELELARRADEREMPVFGICRGAQTINVARGGSLYQHLPDLDGDQVVHRQTDPGETVTHWVEIVPGTRLAEILGESRIEVNSFHHQGVRRLGERLRVSAHSDDGVIEAVEDPDRRFLIGVQWHAEFLVERPHEHALFRAFIDAALEYEAAGVRAAA